MMKKKNSSSSSVKGVLDVLGIGLATATVLGFLGGLFWLFDLFAHFRVQYMQISLVLLGLAIWKRWNRRAAGLIVLIVLNYAFILPLYFNKPEPATEKPVRAMLMNLNASNGNTAKVLETIDSFDPDLLVLEQPDVLMARIQRPG